MQVCAAAGDAPAAKYLLHLISVGTTCRQQSECCRSVGKTCPRRGPIFRQSFDQALNLNLSCPQISTHTWRPSACSGDTVHGVGGNRMLGGGRAVSIRHSISVQLCDSARPCTPSLAARPAVEHKVRLTCSCPTSFAFVFNSQTPSGTCRPAVPTSPVKMTDSAPSLETAPCEDSSRVKRKASSCLGDAFESPATGSIGALVKRARTSEGLTEQVGQMFVTECQDIPSC